MALDLKGIRKGENYFIQHVFQGPTEEPGRMLPTDDYGKVVYPVIDSDTGRPLPTDTSGRHVAIDTGEILPTDDFGRPLDKEGGQILPTNRYGHYIYTRPTIKPTTLTQPQSVAVGIPGEPGYEAGVTLPTDAGTEPPSDVVPSGDGVVAYPVDKDAVPLDRQKPCRSDN